MINRLNDSKLRLQAALYYQSLNLPIIPVCSASHKGMSPRHLELCRFPGKTPIIKQWSSRSTPTVEEVQEWYRGSESNIGLVLGLTSNWNLVGIDADGEAGERLLAEWSQGVLPDTWEFSTGNGRRLLYRLPDGVDSKKFKEQDKQAEHQELALIVSGQQTVLPPSMHASGRLYQWLEGHSPADSTIADAPMWILNRVLAVDSMADSGTNDMSMFMDGPASPPVTASDWTTQVPAGGRSNHMTRLAGSLVAKRTIPKEQILPMLMAVNLKNCKPPLPEVEVAALLHSVYQSEMVKAEKIKKAKKVRGPDQVFDPAIVAKELIEEQQALGIRWKYVMSRGVFYTCNDAYGPWKVTDPIVLRQAIRPHLVRLNAEWGVTSRCDEVLETLKELLLDPLTDECFDLGKHGNCEEIYLRNGTLHWKTKTLMPWDSACYSAVQLPVDWDPEAVNSAAYKRWIEVLHEWIPDPNTILFLQEYIGYCLIPTCDYRTAVFLYGEGRNGKSLFLDAITPLFGEHTNNTSLQRLNERFETVSLADKLVNICADIDSNYIPDTGNIKCLISGDPIRGEYKFGKSFTFKPVARMLFSANTLPKASDKSEGWYSRWRFVSFPNQFEVDPSYKIELLDTLGTPEARSALLCWAIEGLVRLTTQGRFTGSKAMDDSSKEYQTENDSVCGFAAIALMKVKQTGANTVLATSSLHAVYKTWATAQGHKPLGSIEFVKRLCSQGYEKGVRTIRNKSVNCFIGVQFREEIPDLDLRSEYNLAESLRIQA